MRNLKFDTIVSARHSVRKFYDKKPDWREIIEAIDAGRKAPLAGNIPSVKFILVDDKEKINLLADACNQSFVSQVSYVVVVCSDKTDVVRSYDERGERYTQQQAGAAVENFLLKLTELKLGTCWVGAFVDEQVKRILDVPDSIDIVGLFPIGYPMLKESQKRKPSLDRCLYFNKWKGKYMVPRKRIEGH